MVSLGVKGVLFAVAGVECGPRDIVRRSSPFTDSQLELGTQRSSGGAFYRALDGADAR
jgi:hypothetical protein